MKTSNNINSNESVDATRRAASKNNADVDALRKLPTLDQAREITIKAEEQWRPTTAKEFREGNKFQDEIKVGDRVYSRNYETMGTVVGRYWWNGDNCYRVRMDRECEGGFGSKFIVTSFRRDGITKNIGKDGREIIGNAEYYRETLFASWWGFNGEPRTFSFGGQRIDIYDKNGQEWEVVSHHQNGEPTRDTMTTGEVCEWLSRLYSKSQDPALETSSEITEQREQNDACISSAESRRDKANGQITEKPQPSSWVTDYTYDDFAKLEANPEAIEADPDIMGKRFRLTAKDGSAPLSELQVFIQDYAGNERHALYYIWDEWMQEVRANVRPLDWLREHFCHANGWQPVAA